ncbi:MAG: aspartyl/asparaginyl beta-hydroxylase domain-containing protein [Pseudomonadota bacterium]
MPTTSPDARSVAHAAIDKLRAGDAAGARALFEQLTAAGLADASIFHCLAQACGAMGEYAPALIAVERALAIKPANVYSLLLKADLLTSSGDGRGATAFYKAALKAAPAPQQMPADMHAELGRAQAMIAQHADKFAAHLVEQLAAAGLDDGRESRRFAQSLDLLLRKKEVYVQSPRFFYFPGLPNIQYFERDDFAWLDRVEAAAADIRAELMDILREDGAFEPYVQNEAGVPTLNQGGLINNPDWSAFYLWKNGEFMAENAARCPRTLAALADVPLSSVPGRSPSVLFSLLRPGAHIPAHTGVLNTRMICHLPLIVPPGCFLRVGNEKREWVEGKAWVFDDTIEHEAWNTSDQTRVILLFEAWRPELTERERALVTTMFAAIDGYGEPRVEWDM